jgi:primosomal protein N'
MPRYAHVAFPLYVDQLFTYTLPPQWQTTLHPGWRVLAPFGRKKITGLIVRTDDHCNIANPKPIAEPLDAFAVIPPDLMRLAEWMSDYYMTPIGQVIAAMLPPGIDRETVTMIRLVQDIGEFEIQQVQKKKPLLAKILRALFVYHDQPLKKLQKRVGSKNLHKHLEELEHKKIIQIEQVLDDPDVQALSTKFITLAEAFIDEPDRLAAALESLPKKSARQRAVLELLAAHHSQFDGREEPLLTQQEVLSRTRAQLTAVKTLASKGYLRIVEQEKIRFPVQWSDEPELAMTLTTEQQHAVNEIDRALEKPAYHGNAIKFTYPGGRVVVSCSVSLSDVTLTVADTGQGLTSEDMKHLFTSFRRLSSKPTAGESSTGLGLAIVKKIVEHHGGKLHVESRKGEGTAFSFSLPISR